MIAVMRGAFGRLGADRVALWSVGAAATIVAISGAASAFFVTLANAWMSHPAGFAMLAGVAQDVRPWQAMFPPGWAHEVLHVVLSCYVATGFAVAGIHARFLLRDSRSAFHRAALVIALAVGGVAAILQPLSGDLSARQIARTQPLKLAAIEGLFESERGAPLSLGGLPDSTTRSTRWAIKVPRGLSLLAFHDPDAEVKGLDAFPRDTWPNTRSVHVAFQTMVAIGSLLALVAVVGGWLSWRTRTVPLARPYLKALVAATPGGFVALEAGWLVTEWGRQPFTVHGVLRTADSVTQVQHLGIPLVAFLVLYAFLGVMVAVLLWRQIAHPEVSS